MEVFPWLAGLGDFLPAEFAFWRQPVSDAWRTAATWAAALSYFLIPAAIVWLARRRPDLPAGVRLLGWIGFIAFFALGAWQIAGLVSAAFSLTDADSLAAASLAAGIVCVLVFWLLFRRLVTVASPAELVSERDRAIGDLEVEAERTREAALLQTQAEQMLSAKTSELALTASRLDTCLRGAKVYLFSQDSELRYNRVFGPRGEDGGSPMLGRTDEEVFAAPDRDAIVSMKRKVLETGEPAEMEAWHDLPEGRALLALHIERAFGPDGAVDGVRCAAADITRIRSLEAEQRRLAEELRNALHRYEIALRGSNVTVFTHDRDLRYTSISNAFMGRRVDQIIGLTDDDVVPVSDRDALVAVKRGALETGESTDAELRLKGPTSSRWYDFHVEPLRDAEGRVAGLTCAAVDITERKAGEEHLRLLMRELTHRSKNLLAVIQALARQTSRHAVTIDSFLDQFTARLQALSRSHDLLVQEEWHSASLRELVRSQLGHYLDRDEPQITVGGPAVHLKPEAAQSLGLALHELAVNAAKYGALSVPEGRVSVTWEENEQPEDGLMISWLERNGPAVEHPKKHGFGSLAIQRNLSRTLEADVDLNFAEDGVVCLITVPAKHLFSLSDERVSADGT